jgi:hypothetical protein
MIRSLGTTTDRTDVLAISLGSQHSFLLIQGGNLNSPLVVPYSVLLKAIASSINIPAGSAAWGSIATGTGVGSQADLVAYLNANYIDSGDLAAALANYVPITRTLTINGVTYDLSADRSWTISGGVTSVNGQTGVVILALDDISNVNAPSPTAGQILQWNGTDWIAATVTGTGTVQQVNTGTGLTGGPITTTGTISLNSKLAPADSLTGNALKVLRVNAGETAVEYATATGLGTVTSVAATVPTPTNPAFSVAVPNPTTTPSIDITANGIVSQYIRGDGSLANFPSSGGGGSSLNYYLNGSVSQGTLGGVAFRQMSSTPVIGAGTNFSISSDGYIQSFITDASVPNQLLIPAGNWLFEMYFQSSSAGGSPRFYIELYKLSGGTLSLIASSVANPEFITNGTAVDLYTTAVAVPSTVLLAADRLAVRVYVIHSGRTITLHTEDSNLCEVITTFSTGITALNGLTAQIQNLTTGTSGTDFGITSSIDTHTFNLPTASATNRGALSSADWTVFNGKQDALILTTTGSSGPATLTGATLNIPQYSGGSGGITALTGDVAASGTGSVVATLASNLKTGSFGVTVDGVTGVVQVGNIGYVVMPYAGTITGWSITSNVVGTVSFDITSASGAIPTISIIASGYPTISGINFATSTSVGGWSTSFAAGDVFGFSVRSSPAPSLIKNATLTIRTTRS